MGARGGDGGRPQWLERTRGARPCCESLGAKVTVRVCPVAQSARPRRPYDIGIHGNLANIGLRRAYPLEARRARGGADQPQRYPRMRRPATHGMRTRARVRVCACARAFGHACALARASSRARARLHACAHMHARTLARVLALSTRMCWRVRSCSRTRCAGERVLFCALLRVRACSRASRRTRARAHARTLASVLSLVFGLALARVRMRAQARARLLVCAHS